MERSIVASNITKKYKLYNGMKERMLDLITPKAYGKDFYALSDVSFEAEKGDVIGFIGINGSGKSTLSNIVAGIVPETAGNVSINGQVSLIAVASGLKGDLTGRDNIELKCLMLGFNKKEIIDLEPEIIEFSELGDFIDQPVKSYSSGMKSRLGFAISVTINPDILIIDEALSVGDKAFAEKSLNKMNEFKDQGKTMIFVSHSIGQMKKFCEKILWLEYGTVKDFGSVEDVMPRYEKFLKRWQKLSKKERDLYRKSVLKHDQETLNRLMNAEQKAKSDRDSSCTIRPTSRIGKIKDGDSFIYYQSSEAIEKKSSESYKESVYYIKKEATCNDEFFYLLSNRPSAKEGVIGWIKASDLDSFSHVAIDNDPKTFYTIGTGGGFSRAWGGKKNWVYPNLKSLKNCEFKVSKTEMVGKNIWYYGELDGKHTWIHQVHLKELKT